MKNHTYYLAIDPGYTGAVARLRDDGKLVVKDIPVQHFKRGGKNRTEYQIFEFVNILRRLRGNRDVYGVIEDVGPQPGKFSAQANFHLGAGKMLAAVGVASVGIPYEFVNPTRWKRAMGIPAGSDKRFSLTIAQRLFPDNAELFSRVTKDHGRADAALMAEWLRRQRGGAG